MQPKSPKLRVLHFEDNENDATLVAARLETECPDCELVRVRRWQQFEEQIAHGDIDLALLDFNLPGGDGLDALRVIRRTKPPVPVIMVSGSIGEDQAVACLREGAVDYLFKDRPERLGPAVQRAFQEADAARKRLSAEEALRESERRYRHLFESNPHPMWVYDLESFRFLAVNNMAVERYGYRRDEFLAMTIRDIRPPEDVPALMVRLQNPDTIQPRGRLWRHRLKNGAVIDVEITSHRLVFEGRNAEFVLAVDVTEQLRIVSALEESEARFRELAEHVQEVFYVFDVKNRQMLYVSPAYEVIWQRRCESLYAKPFSYQDSVIATDLPAVQAARNAQTAGERTVVEYRIQRPDGEERWIRDTAYPVKGADGTVSRIVGTAHDITERKKLEERFLRAQRLESVGTLAGGIAHDLNNVLAPMLMAVELVRRHTDHPEVLRLMGILEKSGRHGAALIRQVLAFARGTEGERSPIQLRHSVEEVASMLAETLPRAIAIETDVPRELPLVLADPTQIGQVLMNLSVNARDAMPSGGTLRLEAREVEILPEMATQHHGARAGPFVCIRVSDTGTGMPPEILQRIFDPFFTTKAPGKGTGLGLSTAVGIMKSHGGFLTVQSAPGAGTAFELYFPALGSAPVGGTEDTQSDLPASGLGELILVVDDEEAIREVTCAVLQMHGYRTIAASDGGAALDIFQRHPEINGVITDLMMPKLQGTDLIAAIRAHRPGMPVVATSGVLDTSLATRDGERTAFLAKPMETEALLRAVASVLSPQIGNRNKYPG